MPKVKSGAVSKSRLILAMCVTDNYRVRVARTALIVYGAPVCPVCRCVMVEIGGASNE